MTNDLTPDTRHLTPTTADERLQQIRAVIDDCLVQRAAGLSLSDGAIIARYLELMPELDDELKRIQLIAGARQRVDESHQSDADASSTPRNAADSSIRLQCPHCQAGISLSADASWSKVNCSACGHDLKLVGDDGGASGLQPGSIVGRFELLECIGSGGFGVVWKARDPQLDRVVALKVPRRGELSNGETELFFREARAAAQVRHPNIVSIHEVGRDGDAVYLVSDFVDGLPLSEFFKAQRLTTREAATLCQQIAEALAHIHDRGIVHRDLKPANVIVMTDDVHGLRPHLTDFGMARRAANEVTVTADGQLMGTPAYMSPEQAAGGGHAAGPASDVYSLGVIFFELLTGDPPFRGAPTMVIDQVLHDEPVSPRRLNAYVPRDLETITLKCLEKDPAKRYATAQSLADDLERWLRGEPIVARPLGRLARTHRWCRRHPAATIVALVLGLGGPAVGLITTTLAWRASTARETAESAEQRTRQVLYASTMRNVQTAVEQGDQLRAEQLLLGLRPEPGHADLRGFAWYYWWRQSHVGLVATVPLPDNQIVDSATFGRLRQVAAGRLPKVDKSHASLKAVTLELNEPETRPWVAYRIPKSDGYAHDKSMSDAAISKDERMLATCGHDGTVQLWDATTGVHRATLRGEPQCSFERVDISPKCKLVAAATTRYEPERDFLDSEVYVWNVETGQIQRRSNVPGIECEDLVFSLDEEELVVAGGGAPLLINLETGEQRTLAPSGRQVTRCDYSPDGRQLVGISGNENDLWLWDLDTGKITRTLSPHSYVSAVRFYPTAEQVVSVGNGDLKLWSIPDSTSPRSLLGQWPPVTEPVALRRIAFTKDGQRLVSGNSYRWISIWDLSNDKEIHILGPELRSMSLSRDANVIAAYCGNDVVLYSASTGERKQTLRGLTRTVSMCQIADSGALIASGDGHPDEQVDDQSRLADAILWDAKTGRLLHRLPGHHGSVQLAIAPDEQTLVTVDRHHDLRIWDVTTGKLIHRTNELQAVWGPWGVQRLVFSRDGKTLYACSGNSVQAVDPLTGTLRRKMAVGTVTVSDICLSPDERTLAVARGKWSEITDDEGVVELWDLSSGELKTTLAKEYGSAICVAFSPDGRTLASGHRNGNIALWQAATDDDVRRQAPD